MNLFDVIIPFEQRTDFFFFNNNHVVDMLLEVQ